MKSCRCKTIQHKHGDNQCDNPATEIDGYCKECYDRAAEEFNEIKVPNYIPPRR